MTEAFEARHQQLKLLEKARVIRALGLAPRFALMGSRGRAHVPYIADFVYVESGRTIVEGPENAAAKLFRKQYPEYRLKVTPAPAMREAA